MKKKKVFKKIDILKQEDEAFADLILRSDKAIMSFLETNKRSKSYRPKRNKKLKVVLEAVPLTRKEFKMLERYLEKKYLNKVRGDYIVVKKCPLKKLYKITSKFFKSI